MSKHNYGNTHRFVVVVCVLPPNFPLRTGIGGNQSVKLVNRRIKLIAASKYTNDDDLFVFFSVFYMYRAISNRSALLERGGAHW